MTIAYQTGTANGSQDLFDQLVTWLLAHGWTLVDAVTTGDKVFSSAGTNGKEKMIVRITRNEDAGNPWKWGYNKWRSGIQIRGYQSWDAVGHTGTGRYGKWGPMFFMGHGSNTVLRTIKLFEDATKYPGTQSAEVMGNFSTVSSRPWEFTGRHRLIGGSSSGNNFTFLDPASGATWTSSAAPEGVNIGVNQPVYVLDPATGREYVYCLSTATTNFYRYSVDDDTWTALAQNPWAASCTNGGLTWDGNDTIYGIRGVGTTSFAKYTISTNTWAALAALPSARSNIGGVPLFGPVYIPASVTGLGNDIILIEPVSNNNTINRYNVGLDTWTSPLTFSPADTNLGQSWTAGFDNQRYILFINTNSNNTSRDVILDLSTLTFSNAGILNPPSGATAMQGGDLVSAPTASVYVGSTAVTYHFLGDADAFFVGVRENNRDHWAYYGRYDSFSGNGVATLTAPSAAGFLSTFTVDDSSSLVAGQVVAVSDGTNTELVTVYDVPNGTSFRANATKTHASGSRAAAPHDVLPYVCTGSSSMASTPLDSQAGYNQDYINQSYFLRPLLSSAALAVTGPTPSGTYQPIPLMVGNYDLPIPCQYANVGTIRLVTCLPRMSAPNPISGDIITIKGKQYKMLTPDTKMAATSPAGMAVVFGPIN